jgi:hypothetical protein
MTMAKSGAAITTCRGITVASLSAINAEARRSVGPNMSASKNRLRTSAALHCAGDAMAWITALFAEVNTTVQNIDPHNRVPDQASIVTRPTT